MDYAVILVDSISLGLRIEDLVKKEGLSYKLIPVPRHLSSDCGFCVRILQEDSEKVQDLLQEHEIEIQAIEAL